MLVANLKNKLCAEISRVVVFYNGGNSRNCELPFHLSELLNLIFQYHMLSTKAVTQACWKLMKILPLPYLFMCSSCLVFFLYFV